MQSYIIKWSQEAIWAIAVAAVVAIGQVISGVSVAQLLSDPGAQAAIVGAAVGRAVLAVVWNQLAKLQAGTG